MVLSESDPVEDRLALSMIGDFVKRGGIRGVLTNTSSEKSYLAALPKIRDLWIAIMETILRSL